jgi:hypothetical protein
VPVADAAVVAVPPATTSATPRPTPAHTPTPTPATVDTATPTVSPVGASLEMGQALFSARHRAERLRNSRLHTAIAERRDESTALIEEK